MFPHIDEFIVRAKYRAEIAETMHNLQVCLIEGNAASKSNSWIQARIEVNNYRKLLYLFIQKIPPLTVFCFGVSSSPTYTFIYTA